MGTENYLDRNPELKRLLLRLGMPTITLTEEDKLKEINELLINNTHWGNCAYENFGIDEEVCGCKNFMEQEKKILEKKLNSQKETTN